MDDWNPCVDDFNNIGLSIVKHNGPLRNLIRGRSKGSYAFYIRKIPRTMTQVTFEKILKSVVPVFGVKFYPARTAPEYSAAVARVMSYSDADTLIDKLHKTPPLHLHFEIALSQEEKEFKRIGYSMTDHSLLVMAQRQKEASNENPSPNANEKTVAESSLSRFGSSLTSVDDDTTLEEDIAYFNSICIKIGSQMSFSKTLVPVRDTKETSKKATDREDKISPIYAAAEENFGRNVVKDEISAEIVNEGRISPENAIENKILPMKVTSEKGIMEMEVVKTDIKEDCVAEKDIVGGKVIKDESVRKKYDSCLSSKENAEAPLMNGFENLSNSERIKYPGKQKHKCVGCHTEQIRTNCHLCYAPYCSEECKKYFSNLHSPTCMPFPAHANEPTNNSFSQNTKNTEERRRVNKKKKDYSTARKKKLSPSQRYFYNNPSPKSPSVGGKREKIFYYHLENVRLKKNETYDVVLTHRERNGNIVVQSVSHLKEYYKLLTSTIQDVEKDAFPSPTELENGEIIAAYCERDSTWYRGRIIKKVFKIFVVEFIDFGYVEEVFFKNIRFIYPSLIEVPKLALNVKISGDFNEKLQLSMDEGNAVCMKLLEIHPLTATFSFKE